MNCGELADLKMESLLRIANEVKDKHPALTNANLTEVVQTARIAVAATGGHMAVEDSLFYEFMDALATLPAKKRARWKGRIDDRHGTRRNVCWQDSMLRVKDDTGRLIPLIPRTMSGVVNRDGGMGISNLMPPFRRKQLTEEVLLH